MYSTPRWRENLVSSPKLFMCMFSVLDMEQFSQENNTVAQELFSFATGNSPNGVLGGLRLRKFRPIVPVSYIQGTDHCWLLGTALENEYNVHVKNIEHVIVKIQYNEHVKNDVHVIVKIEDNEHVKNNEDVIVQIEYNEHLKINVLVLSIQSYNKLVVAIFRNIALVVNNALVFIVSFHIVNDLRHWRFPKTNKIVSEIVSIGDRSILAKNR